VSDIFKEVDEDLRRDQAARLWAKYGRYVIGAAVAVVLATAVFQVWNWWDKEQRAERSAQFVAAMELMRDGDSETAAAQFGAMAEADGSYGTLAAFNEARLQAEAGNAEAAVEILDMLAESAAAGPSFQGVATILAVLHQIDQGDPAALEARLKPLTEAGSGFRPTALELTAVLALRQGDSARAVALYTQVADDRSAPAALRRRASQMLAALGK